MRESTVFGHAELKKSELRKLEHMLSCVNKIRTSLMMSNTMSSSLLLHISNILLRIVHFAYVGLWNWSIVKYSFARRSNNLWVIRRKEVGRGKKVTEVGGGRGWSYPLKTPPNRRVQMSVIPGSESEEGLRGRHQDGPYLFLLLRLETRRLGTETEGRKRVTEVGG